MVTTADVTSVDRLVRVIMCSMEAAHDFQKDPRAAKLAMLDLLRRELTPLLETFSRPLHQVVQSPTGPGFDTRVIKIADWRYMPGKPEYHVCLWHNGWLLVRKYDNHLFVDSSSLLADLLGESGGGTSLFIEKCAVRVRELFLERRRRLDQLEQGCLLREIYEAFEPSKLNDMLAFLTRFE